MTFREEEEEKDLLNERYVVGKKLGNVRKEAG